MDIVIIYIYIYIYAGRYLFLYSDSPNPVPDSLYPPTHLCALIRVYICVYMRDRVILAIVSISAGQRLKTPSETPSQAPKTPSRIDVFAGQRLGTGFLCDITAGQSVFGNCVQRFGTRFLSILSGK